MTGKLTKSSFKLITLLLESPWQLMPTLGSDLELQLQVLIFRN